MSAELFADLAGARIAVIGDVMLDHHVYGVVSRISDEAPVPVLHVRDERRSLGGAANVAANAAALGVACTLVGLVGDDAAGGELARLAEALAPRLRPQLSIERGRPTITKTRYLGGQQQIVRVDRETTAAPSGPALAALIESAQAAIAAADVVALSDYGKGVLGDEALSAALQAATAVGKPVIVDPKRTDYSAYRGAALITPNRRELTLATGMRCESDEEAEAAAGKAMAASGAAILLTRSEKGMSLFRPGAAPVHLPAQAREVFDVSGAGDTVVAALAAALAAGRPIEEAMAIANAAAGVVVTKLGTAVVTPEELAAALAGQSPSPVASGLASTAQARARRAAWAAQGLTVGFANGVFDLIHPGHVSLIAQAAAACDRLIVALNSDESVRRLKGPSRPIQPLAARAAVIQALRGVDLVVSFDEDTPLALIEALSPDVLVKGADYREDQVVGADLVKARGGRVLLAALTPGESTSAIVARGGGG